ncbi:MAG: hypothetical protein B7Y80_20890 [Hyphomicrobium sp. 32-62-53]|nr:MAG: hypothetical protein B7Z29_20260 [Hyphomicrobium sp. 12-62-95]OYX97091.1 MAG: hypothetical protein B7Y80_20890 [Hyphomicrobium sp. 32-62-53]
MDAAQQRVANFADLQASTTTEQVFDINGNVITASIGRAGYVGTTFYGNPGNYVDARGVLNPNGVGNASEMIAGTAANDTIIALGGNDTVRAGAGNDTIEGGSGVDFLYGGDGNDTIDGGTEDDFLYGEAGNDTMRGGIGIDTMFGSDGNDTMYGGLDADVMIGGTGNDIMYGGDGVTDAAGILDPDSLVGAGLIDDTMNGGQGDDTLYGGGGWDSLNGDSGHDLLIPGSGGLVAGGREAMDGGQGDDIYIIESIADFASHDIADSGLRRDQLVNKTIYRDQDATRTANGTANGIAIDEVRFTQTTPGDIILAGTNPAVPGALPSLFTGIERVVIGTGGADTADRTGTAAINIDASLANPGLNEGLEIWGNAGSNIIVGTAFDDVIDGGGGADTMEGGLGNDRYVLDQADDIVIEGLSGGGNDTIVVAGNFNYTLADDIENLTLQGTNNNQDGTGNALDNILIGSGSANRLLGLAGNDTIDGGGGDDTIIGGAGVDRLTGGDGNDTFIFASMAEIGNNASFRETITDFRPQGRTDLDLLDLTAIDADTGTAGHQSFNYANILSSGDSTNLQAGQLLYVNGVLYGGTNGSAGADFQIALNNGPTSLTRAMFVENPTLSIAKQGAAATNEGNTGTVNHVFIVTLSRAVSVDTTVDWSVSHTGDTALNATDFVVNNTVLPQGTLTILAGQTSGTITIPVHGDTIVEANETFQVTLSNSSGVAVIGTASATSTITNDDSNAVITGTNGNDTLNGTAGPDVINGLGGNDTLNGNAGDDVLDGGTGNDTLNGGNGSDTLIGGAGRDIMTGGLGSDIFRFNANIAETRALFVGNDQITDFVSGVDIIDLSAIDANTSTAAPGNQAFEYIGSAAFTGLGQLRYANGQLQGNVSGSNAADFTISITNNPATLQATDFLGVTTPQPTLLAQQSLAFDIVQPQVQPEPTTGTNAETTNPSAGTGVNSQIAASAPPINGTTANETLNGTAQAEVINGLGGNDTLNGNAGNDVMNGGTGNDTLNGGDGNDTLDGGTGTDILNGGNGNDLLIGSAGRDTMTGGADSDTFRFNASVTEIGNLTFGFSFSNDQITDFTPGQDVIDLSAIDANTSIAGDQTFEYIGSAAFSGLGQLRYQNGQLQGNVTGSNAADFTISITNNPATLTNGDFIL